MSKRKLLSTKMLLATDGSEEAELAARAAVELANSTSSGLRGIRRTLAGSVSESVFRHARCPVMVVRAKGNPPSRRGGGRPRVRRVFSHDAKRSILREPG